MPFDINLLNNVENPNELQIIDFSNKDFSDPGRLVDLSNALRRFEKLKFILEKDITEKNKTIFIELTVKFLQSHPKVQEFDLSNNNLVIEELCPKKPTTGGGRGKRLTRGVGRGRGGRIIHTPFDLETCDDLLNRSLQSTLKTINLSNNLLFSKESNLQNVRSARLRRYEKIDLRNTYATGENFTLGQLFTVVKPFSEIDENQPFAAVGESVCQIMVSRKELPEVLQKELDPKVNDVDLMKIAVRVMSAYREKCFDENINCAKDPQYTKTLNFKSPLESLTDEETQQLSLALQNPNCKVSGLNLSFCNLSYLVPGIKGCFSLLSLNVSKLGFGSELLAPLNDIFSSHSKIRRLLCDYRLFLEPGFKQILEGIQSNPESKLKSVEKDNPHYIELIDGNEELSTSPSRLIAVINTLKAYSQENSTVNLTNIKIVIDLSILGYELESRLASEGLLPFPQMPGMSYDYDSDKHEKREDPLLFNPTSKLILSPCYDTHSKVINFIEAYLQEKIQEENRSKAVRFSLKHSKSFVNKNKVINEDQGGELSQDVLPQEAVTPQVEPVIKKELSVGPMSALKSVSITVENKTAGCSYVEQKDFNQTHIVYTNASQKNQIIDSQSKSSISSFDGLAMISGTALIAVGLMFMFFQPHLGLLGFLLLEIGCCLEAVGVVNMWNDDTLSSEVDDSESTWELNITNQADTGTEKIKFTSLLSPPVPENRNDIDHPKENLVVSQLPFQGPNQ